MHMTKLLRVTLVAGLTALVAACASPKDTGPEIADDGPAYTLGSVEHFRDVAGDRVFFDFDRFDLRSDAQATLRDQAEWLKQYTNYEIVIEGHCDERGTREYNLALGDKRATAVRNFLVALGVPASRVRTISYGKERPEALGSTESAWSQNRRGVTVLE